MTLKNCIESIEAIRREGGMMQRSALFDAAIERLVAIEHDSRLQVDVFVGRGAAAIIGSVSVTVEGVGIHLRTIANIEAVQCSIELHRASVCAFVALPEELKAATVLEQKLWQYFIAKQVDYAKCLLLVIGAVPDPADWQMVRANIGANMDVLPLASWASAPDLLAEVTRRQAASWIDACKTLSAGPVVEQIRLAIADEQQSLGLRKQVLSAEADRLRKGDGSLATGDISSTLKQVLQKDLQDIDRMFRLKYEELLRANVGAFSKAAEAAAHELAAKELLRVELAAKFETYETRIDEKFTERFRAKMQATFRAEAEKDIAHIDRLFEDAFSRATGQCLQRGMTVPARHEVTKPSLDLAVICRSHFSFGKAYRGEMTKPGVMEYFLALRDYTGMIMIVVGIIGPLTLIATPPDVDCKLDSGAIDYAIQVQKCVDAEGWLWTRILQLSLQMKVFRTFITVVTAALVAAMIVYGFFDLRKRIPLKRLQEAERDLRQAREFAAEQGERMFSEGARDWVSAVSQYVKDYMGAMQATFEGSARLHAQVQADRARERRRSLDLEQASIEHKLKGVGTADRLLEGLTRRLQDSIARATFGSDRKGSASA
jgi:hypothetical protein